MQGENNDGRINEMLKSIEDKNQQCKVRYTIKEVVFIVFCCTLSNVDEWEDMEMWANHYIDLLREYLPYENGIPSHDTIQRVMGMIDPEYIQQADNKWTTMLEKEEKEKLKKIIAIDTFSFRITNIPGAPRNDLTDSFSFNYPGNECELAIKDMVNCNVIVISSTLNNSPITIYSLGNYYLTFRYYYSHSLTLKLISINTNLPSHCYGNIKTV